MKKNGRRMGHLPAQLRRRCSSGRWVPRKYGRRIWWGLPIGWTWAARADLKCAKANWFLHLSITDYLSAWSGDVIDIDGIGCC